MSPIITEPTALATVKQLNDDVEVARLAAFAARDAHAEVLSRRTDLRRVLADHNAAEPAPEPDVTAELGELLASNPAAAASADWTSKLRESQDATAAAVKAWQGKRTIIDQALARLDAEAAERSADFEAATAKHEQAWTAFVNAARNAMTDELELRWSDFYATVMGPLDALNNARRLYDKGPVYSGVRRSVTHDSILMIGTPNGFGGCSDGVKLYPSDNVGAHSALLTDFRARLSESAPPAPRGKAARS